MADNEGMNRIVTRGVLPAIQAEIDKCLITEGQTVDNTAAAIRMILDAYDKYFQTGRTREWLNES